MLITSRHRKSAEEGKAKGASLLRLPERAERPVAALFALMAIGIATLFRSAAAEQSNEDMRPEDRHHAAADGDDLGMCVPTEGYRVTANDLYDPNEGAAEDHARNGDLGRIGRGPGPVDLSRFFADADLDVALPGRWEGAGPSIRMPEIDPMSFDRVAGGAPGRANPGVIDVDNGGGNTGGNGDVPDDGIVTVSFDKLFTEMASAVGETCPQVVRQMTDLVIGDWISQHELYRLRGGEVADRLDARFLAGEDRTHQLLSNPDSRELYVSQHFPTVDFADTVQDPAHCHDTYDTVTAPSGVVDPQNNLL